MIDEILERQAVSKRVVPSREARRATERSERSGTPAQHVIRQPIVMIL